MYTFISNNTELRRLLFHRLQFWHLHCIILVKLSIVIYVHTIFEGNPFYSYWWWKNNIFAILFYECIFGEANGINKSDVQLNNEASHVLYVLRKNRNIIANKNSLGSAAASPNLLLLPICLNFAVAVNKLIHHI